MAVRYVVIPTLNLLQKYWYCGFASFPHYFNIYFVISQVIQQYLFLNLPMLIKVLPNLKDKRYHLRQAFRYSVSRT